MPKSKLKECPTCGMKIKFHDAWLLNAHINMHNAHKKANQYLRKLIKQNG